MTLHLYNTLSRAKEEFVPLKPDTVGLYVCGPTVYDFAHIGNARPVVVFDMLYRLLRRLYGSVTYVRNITDVDDKIIAASQSSGDPIEAITTRTTEAFHRDMAALGALDPDIEPRATAHIDQMIAMIETLIAKGHAYEADGHVLFNVPSMSDYGQLSRLDRREVIEGARVEVASYKKDAADFVLWKPSTDDQPGWSSPWGRGRPGWHIECSAMSGQYLGETFDIHGGGQDLIFPHHENEIAQSRCAHGHSIMARFWMHNGYLMVEGEKMSKSLGNFFTVRELLREFSGRGEAIRFLLLSTHYRQPLDFTKAGIAEAINILNKWYRIVDTIEAEGADIPSEVLNALEDDLNTPLAIAELHKLANQTKTVSGSAQLEIKCRLKAGAQFLGFLTKPTDEWFRGVEVIETIEVEMPAASMLESGLSPVAASSPSREEIDALIAERVEARKAKDFTRSDQIRDELKEQGILLEDGPGGTTWRRA